MVKPNEREKKEVGKITALTRQEVVDLKDVLMALGFDYETIALMWNKSATEVEAAFSTHGLSGEDLLFFCEHIRLRPGVIQRKLNFDRDETRLRTQKVGFKSRLAPAKWIGPPDFCLVGNASDGKAFREVYTSPGVSVDETLEQKILQQIANGNWPVRLPLLDAVVNAARRIHLNHRKLPRLEAILASFPEGIQTVEDVFAPAKTIQTRPEEGQVMNKADVTFANSFAAAGLSSKLADFIEKLSLTGWVYEHLDWDDDVINAFADGEQGPLPEQLKQFLSYCTQEGIMGSEALKEMQGFCDENCEDAEKGLTGQSGPEKGHYGELWYADRVEIYGVTIPLVGGENPLPKRIYTTLKAIRDAFDLQWPEIEGKIGLAHENVIAMQSGKQVLKPKFLEVIPRILKKHFEVDLTIQEILGIDELPSLVSNRDGVQADAATPVPQPHESQTVSPPNIPANGWPQKEIAQFIVQAIAQKDSLVLRDVLASIGRNSHFNAQVLKGKQAYSRRDLEAIAELLGVSFADVSTANLSALQGANEPVADGDMQAIARTIASLIESKGRRTFDVLSAVGIRYRPHNAMVIKGREGYTYTEAQLSAIAAELGVSVEELCGGITRSAPETTATPAEATEDVVAEAPATTSDTPQEIAVVQSSSDYDVTDKALRKVVIAQLRKLRDYLGLTAKQFTADVPGATRDIYYGLVRVESFVLKGLVQKHKPSAPWLTFDWFLSAQEPLQEVIPVPADETPSTPVREAAEATVSEAPMAEEDSVSDSAPQEAVAEPVSTPEAESAPEQRVQAETPELVQEAPQPFLQTFANAYGPKTEQSLDWRKLFFVFAKAGYVKGEVVAALLEPFTVHSNVHVDWKKQVLAVAGPILQSVNLAPEMEDITQDTSLMKVLSELSALDVLLLGRALDQSGSRTHTYHVA